MRGFMRQDGLTLSRIPVDALRRQQHMAGDGDRRGYPGACSQPFSGAPAGAHRVGGTQHSPGQGEAQQQTKKKQSGDEHIASGEPHSPGGCPVRFQYARGGRAG